MREADATRPSAPLDPIPPLGEAYPAHFLRYLGTAGARFVTMHQVRGNGGMWITCGGCRGVLDPGPGSLVRIATAVPELDPTEIRFLCATHRHLDHSGDLNILAEAMTGGAFERRGLAILPPDSLGGEEPLLFRYLSRKIERLVPLEDGRRIPIGEGLEVEPVPLAHHGVDVYGLIFRSPGLPTWGVISDTRPLSYLAERFRDCAFLSLNVTLDRPRARLDHFSVPDAARLLQDLHPSLLVLTHLGRGILAAGPESVAAELSTPRTRVVAAFEGLVVDLHDLRTLRAPQLPPDPRSHAGKSTRPDGAFFQVTLPRTLPDAPAPHPSPKSS
jgi:phosphoribosyl 1,2-cyclic phosphodiesterase